MANYNVLKASVDANIVPFNNAQEITGEKLNTILKDMISALGIGYTYMGVVSPASIKALPDSRIFYLCYQPGVYTHFGGLELTSGNIGVLRYDTAWHLDEIPIGGGGSDNTFIATVEETPYEDVLEAYEDGKRLYARQGDLFLPLTWVEDDFFVFSTYYFDDGGNNFMSWKIDANDDWSQEGAFAATEDDIPQVIDNLTSDSTEDALSAKQGKVLKGLVDDLSVEGVISQTQTWAADGLTYTMTNIVRGAIPKHFITAFIELTRVQKYAKGTRYEGSFDYATGYFSLNSLTDISYEEALRIYNAGNLSANKYAAGQYYSTSSTDLDITPRTLIYDLTSSNWTERTGNYFRVGAYAQIETMCGAAQSILNLRIIRMDQSAYEPLQHLLRLWKIDQLNVSAITSARDMLNAKRLRVCNLFNIAANWSFPDSSLMEAASVAYMINYATSGDKTITLHATAYARAIADDDVQAALAAHPNVTLASA